MQSTELPILLPTKLHRIAGTFVNCLTVSVKFQRLKYTAVHVRKNDLGMGLSASSSVVQPRLVLHGPSAPTPAESWPGGLWADGLQVPHSLLEGGTEFTLFLQLTVLIQQHLTFEQF